MNRSLSQNRVTYELNKSSNNISSSFHNSFISHQDTISNLKLKIFEKGQNRQDYQNLLSRYHILKSDLEKISKSKRNNEILLNEQENEEKNIMISKLKNENDILFEKINAQIAMNKKLYYENNLLYKEIGIKYCEKDDLKEQISNQENIITKLSYEKEEIEKHIYKLNEEREKQEINKMNFSEEINSLNNENNGKNILIENKNGENLDIYKQINKEKDLNKILVDELKEKEKILLEYQTKLDDIHNKIKLYENNNNRFKDGINKNYDEINDININIVQEKNATDKIIDENKNINNLIYNKEMEISNIKNENFLLNKENIVINQENNDIYEKLMEYREHLIFLVCQNKNLVSEIQLILGRDDEIKNILNRTSNLRSTLEENKNVINHSNSINLNENNESNIYEQFKTKIKTFYTKDIFESKYNSNNISSNNSNLLNYNLKNKNFSEKLENKYITKINVFKENQRKENNDTNKSVNINYEKEKEEKEDNNNTNSMEKEPNLEENNIYISNDFMNKDENEEIKDI